jgi:transcriptional regulator with XRE-family HTH domain
MIGKTTKRLNQMSDMPMAERLKFLIPQLGLKVGTFARAMNVSDTNVRNYLDRGSKPSSEFLEKLVQTFDTINPTWLLTGQGEPFLSAPSENTSTQLNAKKISRSQVQVAGANKGFMSITVADLERELAAANEKIALLTSQLADKERIIQLLERSGSSK